MNGSGVSAVTAYTAHREWATRPPDERYASVHALYEAARARRNRIEERTIETGDFRTEAVTSDALALREASGRTAALTHWSFEQLATIAGAPPKYLRTLPAAIASDAINYGLQRQRRDEQHAPRGPRRPVDRARDHITAVRARPPRRAGQPGARPHGPAPGLVPAARLQGRRVRRRTGSVRRLPGRPRHVPVPRGRQPRSRRSHRRSRTPACSADSFSGTATSVPPPSPWMCSCFAPCAANHIIWGFQHVAGFRRRHVGASIQDAWTTSLDGVRAALDADTAHDRSCSCGPPPRSSGRRATRWLRRPCSDSICRRSRPPRRTRWRNATRRIPVRSGATCKG